MIMDVAVPLSRYSEMVDFSKKEVRDLTAYLFGHAGDGNIHVHVMDDSQNKKRWARVEEASRNIVMKALEFEGTCTGEHGIGKSRFMETEHGESLLLMRRLKALLDPENFLFERKGSSSLCVCCICYLKSSMPKGEYECPAK